MGGVVWKNVVIFLNLHTKLVSRVYDKERDKA